MIQGILDKIESKRSSKEIFWRVLLVLKDSFWKVFFDFNKYFKENNKRAWKTNKNKVEIEINSMCNLKCINCDRSCRQAPSSECMNLDQIKKFIQESINLKWKWKTIRILGGEPTLHPQFFEILNTLKEYKKFYPLSRIQVVTNGFGIKVKNILCRVPSWILIENTNKKSNIQCFSSYNISPIDIDKYKHSDFSKGCNITEFCGLGLTRYGFYACGAGASVDRIFGFNIGIKKLSLLKEINLKMQKEALCRHCGHYKNRGAEDQKYYTQREEISSDWIKAYTRYKKNKPELSLY